MYTALSCDSAANSNISFSTHTDLAKKAATALSLNQAACFVHYTSLGHAFVLDPAVSFKQLRSLGWQAFIGGMKDNGLC